jgi:exonuclease III
VLLAYANLNFGRSADHNNDVRRMADKGADVICLVELRRLMFAHKFESYQPGRVDGDVGGEAILVRRGRRILGKSKRQASVSLFGQSIGWRQILGVTLDADELAAEFDRFAVLVVHMPPLRMRGPLYAAYALRLRLRLRRLNAKGIPWIVFGDWNWLLENDPARLRLNFGAKWLGKRIDGAAVHPKLAPHVRHWTTWQPLGRHDDHPYVYVTLGPPR